MKDDVTSPETPADDRSKPEADHGAPAPGCETPAPDQTERVILRAAEEEGGTERPCDLLVVADSTGALTDAALDLLAEHPEARVWSWNASYAETAALAEIFAAPIEAGRLRLSTGEGPTALEEFAAGADAHLVLARLPKSLAGLQDLAARLAHLAARSGREDLTLIAGGRVKHMTRSQNDVLAGAFEEVRASRGLGKSRALIAGSPRGTARARAGTQAGTAAPSPATGTVSVSVRGQRRELALRGVAGVFGGARADAGSLLLLDALDAALTGGEIEASAAVDLGSGNGLLTAYLAAALPEASVLGSDDDAAAVASTAATLAASGLDREGVRVTWDASLSRESGGTGADLVLLNPPFHDGTVVDATLVQGLLDATARVLRPGGQLWFVHNSHLRYRPELEARFESVRQRARDRRFTVLSAVARAPQP